MLTEIIIKILLQVVIIQRISFLVLCVAFAFNLKALIRQVDKIILVAEIVLG